MKQRPESKDQRQLSSDAFLLVEVTPFPLVELFNKLSDNWEKNILMYIANSIIKIHVSQLRKNDKTTKVSIVQRRKSFKDRGKTF